MSDYASFPIGSGTRNESSSSRPALRYTNPLLSSFERKEALVFSDCSNRFSEWPSQAAASERADTSNVNSNKQVNFIPTPLLYTSTVGAVDAFDGKTAAKASDEPIPNKLPPKPQPHTFTDSASAISASRTSLAVSSSGGSSRVPLIQKTLSKRRGNKGGASSPQSNGGDDAQADELSPVAVGSSAGHSAIVDVKQDAMSNLLCRAEALLTSVKKAAVRVDRSPDAVAYEGSGLGSRSKPSSTARSGEASRGEKYTESINEIAREIIGTSSDTYVSSFPPMPATESGSASSSSFSGMLYGKSKPGAHATEIDWLLRGVDEAYDDEQVVSDDLIDRLLKEGEQPPSQLLFPFFYEKSSGVMNLLSQVKYLTIDIKQILIYSTNFGIRKDATYFILKGPLGTLTNDSVLSSVVIGLNELNEIESYVEEKKNARKKGTLNDYFVGMKKLSGKQHSFNIQLTNDIIKCWMQQPESGDRNGYDGCIKLELYSYLSSPHNQSMKLRNEPLPFAYVYIPLSNLLTAPNFDAAVTCDLVVNRATNLSVTARMKSLPYSRPTAAAASANLTDRASGGESIGTVSCRLRLRSELESDLKLEARLDIGSGDIISDSLFVPTSAHQSIPNPSLAQADRDVAMTFVPAEKGLHSSSLVADYNVASGYFGLVIYSISNLNIRYNANLSVVYKINRQREIVEVAGSYAAAPSAVDEIDVFSAKTYRIDNVSTFSLPYLELWQQIGDAAGEKTILVGLVKLSIENTLFGQLTTLPVLDVKTNGKVGNVKVSLHFFESKHLCDKAILTIMKTFLIRENKSSSSALRDVDAKRPTQQEQQKGEDVMRQSIDSVLSVDSLSADISAEQHSQVDNQCGDYNDGDYNDNLLNVLEVIETLSGVSQQKETITTTAPASERQRSVLRHSLEVRVDDHTDLFSRDKLFDADLLGYNLYYNMPVFAQNQRPFEFEPAADAGAADMSVIKEGDVTSNVYRLWVDKEFGSTNSTNVHEYDISSPGGGDGSDLLAILTPFFFGGINFYVADSDNGNNILAESFVSFEQIKSLLATAPSICLLVLPVSFYAKGGDKACITVHFSYRVSPIFTEHETGGIRASDGFCGGDNGDSDFDNYDNDFDGGDEQTERAAVAIVAVNISRTVDIDTAAASSSSQPPSSSQSLHIDVVVNKLTHFNFNSVADSSIYCLVQVAESKQGGSFASAEAEEDAGSSEYILTGRSSSAKSPLVRLTRSDGAAGETVDISFDYSDSVVYYLDDTSSPLSSSPSSGGGGRSSELRNKLLVVFVYSVVGAKDECIGYCTVDLSLLARREDGPSTGDAPVITSSPLKKIDGWYHIYSNNSVDIIGQMKLSVRLNSGVGSDDHMASLRNSYSSSGMNSLRNSCDDNNGSLFTFALVNEKISSLEKMSQQLLQSQPAVADTADNDDVEKDDEGAAVAAAAAPLPDDDDISARAGEEASSREASLLSISDEMTAFISTLKSSGVGPVTAARGSSSREVQTSSASSSRSSNPFLEFISGDDDVDAIYDQFNASSATSDADTSHLANLSFVSAPSLERFSLLKRLHVEDKLPLVSIDSVVQKAAASGAVQLGEKISTLLQRSGGREGEGDPSSSLAPRLILPATSSSGAWNQVTAMKGGAADKTTAATAAGTQTGSGRRSADCLEVRDLFLAVQDVILDEEDNIVNADYEYSFDDDDDGSKGALRPSSLDSHDARYVPDFDSLSDSSNDYDYNKAATDEGDEQDGAFDLTASTASTINVGAAGTAARGSSDKYREARLGLRVTASRDVGTSILSRSSSSSSSAESVDTFETFDMNDFDDDYRDDDDNDDDDNAGMRSARGVTLLQFLQQQPSSTATTGGSAAAGPTAGSAQSASQFCCESMSVEVVFSAGDRQSVTEDVTHMMTMPPGFIDLVDALDFSAFDEDNGDTVPPSAETKTDNDSRPNDEASEQWQFDLSSPDASGEEPDSPSTRKIRTIVKEEMSRVGTAPDTAAPTRAGGKENDEVDRNSSSAAFDIVRIDKVAAAAAASSPATVLGPLFPSNSNLSERISKAIFMKKSQAGVASSSASNADRRKFLDLETERISKIMLGKK